MSTQGVRIDENHVRELSRRLAEQTFEVALDLIDNANLSRREKLSRLYANIRDTINAFTAQQNSESMSSTELSKAEEQARELLNRAIEYYANEFESRLAEFEDEDGEFTV